MRSLAEVYGNVNADDMEQDQQGKTATLGKEVRK
jgi:hypothetical protein